MIAMHNAHCPAFSCDTKNAVFFTGQNYSLFIPWGFITQSFMVLFIQYSLSLIKICPNSRGQSDSRPVYQQQFFAVTRGIENKPNYTVEQVLSSQWEESHAALRSQKAVSAYLQSKQILLFGSAQQRTSADIVNMYVMAVNQMQLIFLISIFLLWVTSSLLHTHS